MRWLSHQLGVVRLQQDRLSLSRPLGSSAPKPPTPPPPSRARGPACSASPGSGFRLQLGDRRISRGACRARNAYFAPALFNLALAEAERGNRADARQARQRFSARCARRMPAPVASSAGSAQRYPDDAARLPVGSRGRRSGCRTTPTKPRTTTSPRVSLDRLARLPVAIGWLLKAVNLEAVARRHPQRAACRPLQSWRDRAGGRRLSRGADARPGHSGGPKAILLMAIHHDPNVAPGQWIGRARRHGAAHLRRRRRHSSGAAFPDDPDLRRQLRIWRVFVSPRFWRGCCSAYSSFRSWKRATRRPRTPRATRRRRRRPTPRRRRSMRAHDADAWRGVEGDDLTCQARNVAAIGRDGIDILVDLAGHCPGHRLGASRGRGAPVQFTWMDYVDTTAGTEHGLHRGRRQLAAAHAAELGASSGFDGAGAPTARHGPALPARAAGTSPLAASPAAARLCVIFGCLQLAEQALGRRRRDLVRDPVARARCASRARRRHGVRG